MPHYPKEMIGCFIVQVLDKVKAKTVENDVLHEPFLDSLVLEDAYNSLCICDVEVEEYGNEVCLIEGIYSIDAMKVKNMEVNESCETMEKKCAIFD